MTYVTDFAARVDAVSRNFHFARSISENFCGCGVCQRSELRSSGSPSPATGIKNAGNRSVSDVEYVIYLNYFSMTSSSPIGHALAQIPQEIYARLEQEMEAGDG